MDGARDFIFGPRHNIEKRNIFDLFVKIRHDDVTWRHVTSFCHILLKRCQKVLTSAKIFVMGLLSFILWMGLHKGFLSKDQPLLSDKRFTNYRFFSERRYFADFFLWRHPKNADISKKWWRHWDDYDVIWKFLGYFIIEESFMSLW